MRGSVVARREIGGSVYEIDTDKDRLDIGLTQSRRQWPRGGWDPKNPSIRWVALIASVVGPNTAADNTTGDPGHVWPPPSTV